MWGFSFPTVVVLVIHPYHTSFSSTCKYLVGIFTSNRCNPFCPPEPECDNATVALIQSMNCSCGYILDLDGPFSECARLPFAAVFMEWCIMDVCVVADQGEEAMRRAALEILETFAAVCEEHLAGPTENWEEMPECSEYLAIGAQSD